MSNTKWVLIFSENPYSCDCDFGNNTTIAIFAKYPSFEILHDYFSNEITDDYFPDEITDDNIHELINTKESHSIHRSKYVSGQYMLQEVEFIE